MMVDASTAPALDVLKTWPHGEWSLDDAPIDKKFARTQLELGKILYFPKLTFRFASDEERFLSGRYSDAKAKNINLRKAGAPVRGAKGTPAELAALQQLLERYAESCMTLVSTLFPEYVPHMTRAGTSLRTKEILGRPVSWRKDDTRLHVDSFPSNPVQGLRMLRVFTNIDPDGVAREWRVGEPFADFARRFGPKTHSSARPLLWLMWKLGITKKLRSEYDVRMLQLHDLAKADLDYQRTAPRQDIAFPSGSTWIVFSDQVLHAAMRGKCMMEQTIYLGPEAIGDRSPAPKDVLEGLLQRPMLQTA
jgi:hypothetical protein